MCNDLKIRNMYCARFGRGIHKFCVFGRKYCVLGVVADVLVISVESRICCMEHVLAWRFV